MKKIVWLTLIALAIGTTADSVALPPVRAGGPGPTPATTNTSFYTGTTTTTAERWPDPRPLVWVLDGAGDLKGCSSALTQANALAGYPLELSVFPWSHGHRRLLMDQIDMGHARLQGTKLAQAILERKVQEPGRRIIIIGHSAGCAVALAAGDLLPRDAVDRIILLAPSVSSGYDIRPTMWSAREGLDVFCSNKDWLALGFVMHVVGTVDNFWSASAAGRYGFKLKSSNAMAELEASRLRQHFWSQEMAWTGHNGGHHGMHAPAFIQAYLMPLMFPQTLSR